MHRGLRSRTHCVLLSLMAVAGATTVITLSSTAHAQLLNAGAELGVATRSGSTPGLNAGLAVGVHAELKILPLISVGAYYLGSHHSRDGAASTVSDAGFNTFGGRVRLTLPIPATSLRPYAFAGVGRVGVTYPALATAVASGSPTPPLSLVDRSGYYIETPIGLGLGYQILQIIQLSFDLAARPGMAFSGDVYDVKPAYDHTKMSVTAMFGASLDL